MYLPRPERRRRIHEDELIPLGGRNPDAEREPRKQIAWMVHQAGYDLTEEQRRLLNPPEDTNKKA